MKGFTEDNEISLGEMVELTGRGKTFISEK
jgi:hypothetical protein